ncbi:hypothetical protein [Clostridium cochlearium]|uniref:hypothetical protein n=1 Tax=Clostridium cochlearium TaxID=1494 RepID=UPI00241CB036|nr:hypothetical protein [Clostridium cochlearium]MBE6064821.1 hypothetical protein [Clostridium cochlearium]
MNKKKSFDVDFEEYLSFIKLNIPNSLFISDTKNKELFLSVNTAFKMSDILTDFKFVSNNETYYNLLIEYKKYFARILPAISLNDKFLVYSILRLLTEKLYRIIIGINYPNRGERRIRSDTRAKMSNDLSKVITSDRKSIIDKLYKELSNILHHTDKNSVCLYDIRRLFRTDLNIINETCIITEKLTDIFVEEVFLKKCFEKKELCGTNLKMKIQNNLSTGTAKRILLQI